MDEDKIACDNGNGTIELVHLCTNLCFPDTKYECVKYIDSNTQYFRYAIGSFLALISVIGIFGNVMTLLSIPFCIKKEKFGFEKNIETTIFILNLCFIDITYCLLPQSLSFFCNASFFKFSSCQAMYVMANILGYTEAVAMSLVAISRCLEITKNTVWMKLSEYKSFLYSLAVGTWVVGVLGFSIQIQFDYSSDIGWDCELGVCGHIPWKLTSKFYLVSICFLTSSIALSYMVMWKKVRKSGKVLTRSGSTTLDLEERQRSLTRMILILVFSYIVCNIPMHLNYINSFHRNFYYVSIVLYSAQYAINFIIYHLSSSQYRKATCYFVIYMFSKIICRASRNANLRQISLTRITNRSRTNTLSSASRKL